MAEGEWLYADLACSWMDLADACFKVIVNSGKDTNIDRLKELIKENMETARRYIKRDPDVPHRPDLTEAWAEAAVKYNSKIELCRSQGIELEPINVPEKYTARKPLPVLILDKTLRKGKDVEIPSLDAVIKGDRYKGDS